MTRRRRAAALAAALAPVLGVAGAAPAAAQQEQPRRAFVFLVDAVSFEEALAVPEFRALARAGGAGLLSRRRHPEDRGLGAYLTIGAGAKAAVPSSRIAPLPGEAALPPETLGGIRAVNDGAVPGLLAQVLAAAGYRVAVFGNADDRFGPNAPGLLVAMDVFGVAEGRVHGLVTRAPRLLGALRTDGDPLVEVATTGPGPGRAVADLTVVDLGDTHRIDQEARYSANGSAAVERRRALDRAGSLVQRIVSRWSGRALVVVVAPTASVDMRERGDVVTPVIVAEGPAGELFPSDGDAAGLTSDSTRYPGIVLAEDVAPTVLEFLDLSEPAEMTGSTIRVEGTAPFAAHRRHLDHRRIRIPIQLGFGMGGLALTIAAAAVALRGRASRAGLFAAGLAATCATALPLGLLAAGAVPRLVYGQVLPVVLVVAVGAGALAWSWRRDDPTRPVVLVAAATGLAVVADAALGWRAAATSLAGATVFEGRTYGLRNVWLGPLLAGVVLAGSRLPARRVLAVGAAAAVFAGLPWLGADVGGFVTIIVATGLLYFSLSRGRVGLREAVLVGAAAAAAVVALLIVDGMLTPASTHAGRFAERVADGGIGTFLRVARERLALSLATTSSVPAAWLLLAWLAFTVWAAPHVGGIVGEAFDRSPGYREGMWVLGVSALFAVVSNDTGISTAQTAGAYSIGGFVVPVLALRVRRRGAREGAPRRSTRASREPVRA